MKTTKKEINTYLLPSIFASALINNDNSGLEESDIKKLDQWLINAKPGSCVGVSNEDPYFSWNNDMNNIGDSVTEFYFIKY